MRSRRFLLALDLALFWASPAPAQTLSPEIQLCLQHFRAGERARAEKALGPMDGVPFYRVQLDVDPPARQVSGVVQVSYPVKDHPVRELYLRVTPNAFEPDRVKLSHVTLDGKEVSAEARAEPSLYRVKVDPAAAPGAILTLEYRVTGKVPKAAAGSESLNGLMSSGKPDRTDHGAYSYTPALIGLVGILPMVPPTDDRGDPTPGPTGIGDLALYAPAHVLAAITVPRGWRVHATGEALGEVPEPDGRVRFSFGAAAVRDFPILVSRGYEAKTGSLDDLTVESDYAVEDREIGQRVLGYAVDAAAEFQKRLGPLPYKRLRVVEAPLTDGAGGMEFPGLVTLSTALYRGAMDPKAALLGTEFAALAPLLDSPDARQVLNLPDLGEMLGEILEFSVAHEVAHQYFAGLVGSDPIREPAVDEALAQYAALLYWEWRHGRKAAEHLRQLQLITPYQLFRAMGGRDGPVDRATNEFDSSIEYAALVYGKGPLLHAEERKLLGDATFFKGLHDYVDTYRYRWSCGECLTRVLAAGSPGSAGRLERLRRHWWQERHGDEDLGTSDLGSVFQAAPAPGIDVQSLQQLQDLLKQLGGE